MSDLLSDRQTVSWGSASMNILLLLGPWGWSFGRLLILMLAALGLAVNPSARSAELTTKPNAWGEAGAMSEPRYLLFWRAPEQAMELDRKSTRLNSSHLGIS